MRAALLFASIAIAGVLEGMLLRRIVFHEAGGWATPNEVFKNLLAWASAPLIAAAGIVTFALITRRPLNRTTPAILFAAMAGPVFGYVALAQYSHSTPGFMMLGFACQCIALVVATVRLRMTPNSAYMGSSREERGTP